MVMGFETEAAGRGGWAEGTGCVSATETFGDEEWEIQLELI
jgi:hypothetical protein